MCNLVVSLESVKASRAVDEVLESPTANVDEVPHGRLVAAGAGWPSEAST